MTPPSGPTDTVSCLDLDMIAKYWGILSVVMVVMFVRRLLFSVLRLLMLSARKDVRLVFSVVFK